jgi:hypothetical protein
MNKLEIIFCFVCTKNIYAVRRKFGDSGPQLLMHERRQTGTPQRTSRSLVPSEAIVLHNVSLFLTFGNCSRRRSLIVQIKERDHVKGKVVHIKN